MRNIMGLMGVLFVGLKLTGFITWSWWWVTLPFWGAPIAVIIFFALVLVFVPEARLKVKPVKQHD